MLGRGLRKDRKLPLGVPERDFEQRDDLKLSTLRRYERALGGEVEATAVLRTGHRIRLDV